VELSRLGYGYRSIFVSLPAFVLEYMHSRSPKHVHFPFLNIRKMCRSWHFCTNDIGVATEKRTTDFQCYTLTSLICIRVIGVQLILTFFEKILNPDSLKVNKNEDFFGSDFEFCIISLLVMIKY
jgi:hypothetical protein